MAGLIGSQKAVFKVARKGAPFFNEKRVKVFHLLRNRGDLITFHCEDSDKIYGDRKLTVRLDGCTRNGWGNPHYTPRCVGVDDWSLRKWEWSDLNADYLQKKPAEMMIVSSSSTQEEVAEAVANTYKIPLFDNKGKQFNDREAIEEKQRVVALPFVE